MHIGGVAAMTCGAAGRAPTRRRLEHGKPTAPFRSTPFREVSKGRRNVSRDGRLNAHETTHKVGAVSRVEIISNEFRITVAWVLETCNGRLDLEAYQAR